MKCFVCKKEIENDELNAILISEDGDFACSEKCVKKYKKDKNHFFEVTIKSEKLVENYLKGK
jgi:predicted nucleic acid-binding Zn ribbon protein